MGAVEAQLRSDAHACFRAAIAAVEPQRLVRDFLAAEPSALAGVAGTAGKGPVRVVAIGKAGLAMARGAVEALGSRAGGGVLVVPEALATEDLDGFTVHGGGHPVPNQAGVEGAAAVRRLVRELGSRDTLLCLISGGGSALMTLPPEGVSLEDIQETTGHLLRSGATIEELNAVRKHLDQLKGGRLAAAASPARVLALILSDVVGDPLAVIASGPTVPDPTTFSDAVDTLRNRDLWQKVPAAVRAHLEKGLAGEVKESPKPSDPCFAGVRHYVVGNNRLAAEAALAEAGRRGYGGLLLTTRLVGEASEAGGFLASLALEIRASGRPMAAPACLVAAGETTVTLDGCGQGGRNQELALAAALALDGAEGVLVGAVGTDGIDGPTDAAGATADGTTVARSLAGGLRPQELLASHDSYPLFAALGDLVVTGPTGTNVMDVQVILVAEAEGVTN